LKPFKPVPKVGSTKPVEEKPFKPVPKVGSTKPVEEKPFKPVPKVGSKPVEAKPVPKVGSKPENPTGAVETPNPTGAALKDGLNCWVGALPCWHGHQHI